LAPDPVFVANWKMNLTEPEVISFLTQFRPLVEETEGRTIVVAPAYPSLKTASILTQGSHILVGAQDVSDRDGGSFTGAVSAAMLAAVGCRYVLAGHSERRRIWAEDDELHNRKLRAIQGHGMIPILCVGETAEERREGRANEVVERQIRRGLEGVSMQGATDLALAYEPVWAIGTGDHASPEQAAEMHGAIRSLLAVLYPEAGGDLPVLYGGSVTPANAAALLEQPSIGGLLVGGASLDPRSFASICNVTPTSP
jgi:triosephosphate isomerase (TIM)